MRAPEGLLRFIRTTALGALLAFDATVVFINMAIIVFYGVHDSHSLLYREPLLIWIPFVVAALCTVSLALAAGVGAARAAMRIQGERWSTSFRVLIALAVITLVLLAFSRESAATTILVPAATLFYLLLPALALLFTEHRSGLRLLVTGACVAYGMTIVLLVLTLWFPRFGVDPTQTYDIYFPPQFTAAFFTLGAGALSSVAAGIVCAVDGRLTGHQYWSSCFQVAVVAGLIGPISIGLQIHYPPYLSLSPTLEVALVILAGVSYLALPLMVLVYLHKPPAATSRSGYPDVGTSL